MVPDEHLNEIVKAYTGEPAAAGETPPPPQPGDPSLVDVVMAHLDELSLEEKRELLARLQAQVIRETTAVDQRAAFPDSPHLEGVLGDLRMEGVNDPDPREVERRVAAKEAAAAGA